MTITRTTPLSELPELLTIEEASAWLNIGRGLCYSLVRTRRLASVRLGRLVRVQRDSLQKAMVSTVKKEL